MANAGPNTNGSQYFLVFADSRLRPDYTVFGTIDRLGLKALDKIAAAGIVPTPDDPAPVDRPTTAPSSQPAASRRHLRLMGRTSGSSRGEF
jgi:cyclophilin family peptidyl-prolyl cis-trans isomerase